VFGFAIPNAYDENVEAVSSLSDLHGSLEGIRHGGVGSLRSAVTPFTPSPRD